MYATFFFDIYENFHLPNFVFVFVFLSSGFCLVFALVARVCYCLFFVC